MNSDDRHAIDDLFARLEEVEQKAPPRDNEAEQLIGQKISRQASAPYFMAQTVLVQERALQLAQEKIEQLEAQLQEPQSGGGGFLGGLFGGGQPARQSRQQMARQRGPWDNRGGGNGGFSTGMGGGFLAGAAQTALGVTGGILIGNAIGGLFAGGEAQAQEYQPNDNETQGENDESGDDDFSDGGDFDTGGDF